MNKPMSEKEMLLTMLTDIYDQLEELESVLEASFSDLRNSLVEDEHNKLTVPKQRLSAIDEEMGHLFPDTCNHTDLKQNHVSGRLKLELGF
ncbi:hypothetical protein E2K98_16460 [Bacillus salipaludis]|uniref:Uncharacterized protein n=1 Tax=Bacillus salipaludis TaxID=2547811 RepID=A0A4R5VPF2_9BACI|nr:hypothetical protein [Bacillus salipaludis]MDQ6599426.1 hypothetical protein [Bacillus salipaludis]TDK60298.1 hypothetical protein E2K98_16460 [Bacillus salipaludis]